MIILVDAEKTFDKIQHPFLMIKVSERSEIEGTYLTNIKAIYSKSTTCIKINAEQYGGRWVKPVDPGASSQGSQ